MRAYSLVVPLLIAMAAQATPNDVALLERLAAADSNRDTIVSKAELIAYRAANFARLDRNADGLLSRSDIPSFLRGRAGPVDFDALIDQFDGDRDDRVSREEFVNGPTVLFDRADINRDNLLTAAERSAATARAGQ